MSGFRIIVGHIKFRFTREGSTRGVEIRGLPALNLQITLMSPHDPGGDITAQLHRLGGTVGGPVSLPADGASHDHIWSNLSPGMYKVVLTTATPLQGQAKTGTYALSSDAPEAEEALASFGGPELEEE
ncbi:hypothetical protein [Streptomyces sp. MZ04]|uniref:hypothetical protein n=1 Tax=Streptomyces sp. MZ04 TaxID=2559236 RepID=UPI00107EA9B2|nr:hypothetical protein [Streptomyces sp. MZ04]TGB13311.1 hypothetical protein E2651_09880 [Streptomyces sp. MZ04]